MILFLFLDGVGLGNDDAGVNPFVAAKTPFLEHLLKGKLTGNLERQGSSGFTFQHLDAGLGYQGLPQSATGQTTLLTGKNGAEVMGRHYGPYPGPTLKKVLDQGTLLDTTSCLANLYPPGYFRAIEQGQQKMNVPAYAASRSGVRMRGLEDYRAGHAISAELTGEYLHAKDASLPTLTPYTSGKHLATLAAQYPFTFFDFWLSDQAGHRWAFADCVQLVENLDLFIQGVVENLGDTLLVITSDHGNLEDKSLKTHTFNQVPLLVIGHQAQRFSTLQSLLDVAPVLRSVQAD
jgi:2,3-bisphosphoglycerate-independent phosphoglycerate mutase